MSFIDKLDPSTMIAVAAAVAVVLVVEAVYMVFFARRSYRDSINRRLELSKTEDSRENILIALRRERGLSSEGHYLLPFVNFNKLILQSGLTLGVPKLVMVFAALAVVFSAAAYILSGNIFAVLGVAIFTLTLWPYLILKLLRARRLSAFGKQFPNAIDIIVRSLKAGHPVPIAISMVARELPDPIGSEFGIVADEISYGSDLETAMRSLLYRVGQDDLPLFVTAISIQTTTGGNLSEILGNLSHVIRERFKMRRKIKAISAEGRISAIILSALPLIVLGAVQISSPDFYGDVWQYDTTKITLAVAAVWMMVGNAVMMKMVNFRI
jgi:tight adherence protein B